ncbi:hypothetical protein ACHAPT_011435 [Fusarium lateritium]
MPDLESQIKSAPESVLKRTYGFTTIQLASPWPQGIARLVRTGARMLLHEPVPNGGNLLFLHFYHCQGPSLGALLDAGYTLFPDNSYRTLQALLGRLTGTTAPVIAKHLANRLRRLSKLAANFGIASNDDASIPDFVTAARWCLDLEELGEPIDLSIRVPMSDDMVPTVYHFPSMPFNHFPILYEHGFVHIDTRDQSGLPPMFVDKWPLFHLSSSYFLSQRTRDNRRDIFHMIPWLSQHGFLSQMPHDPLNLGLNVHATGAHRIAAWLGSDFGLSYDLQQDIDHVLALAADILQKLAWESCRDNCVCWCNSGGEGCSPLKLLYKAHAFGEGGIRVYKRYEFQATSIKKLLFDFDIFENPTATPAPELEGHKKSAITPQPSTRALELVRLLTFEALEMTHTCCMLGWLDIDDSFKEFIMNCNPSTVRDIRQCEVEMRNAALLNTLVEEFSDVMQQDHVKSLFDFIFGYWVTRIKKLYALQQDEVQRIQHHIGNVRTGVWPEPLQRLLWPSPTP